MKFRHMIIIFLATITSLPLYASNNCLNLFNHHNSSFSGVVPVQLMANRKDVVKAIINHDESELRTKSELLPKGFLREALKRYFNTDTDQFSFVTLYRGVDGLNLDFQFSGEKNLIWASPNLEDAIAYALNANVTKRAFVIKLVVPKFMVYERSGWPVLRFEDIYDLRPFIEKVLVIPSSRALSTLIERANGDEERLLNFLKRTYPSLFETNSRTWKSGSKIDALTNE